MKFKEQWRQTPLWLKYLFISLATMWLCMVAIFVWIVFHTINKHEDTKSQHRTPVHGRDGSLQRSQTRWTWYLYNQPDGPGTTGSSGTNTLLIRGIDPVTNQDQCCS